jgi:uncharacterized membrane protein
LRVNSDLIYRGILAAKGAYGATELIAGLALTYAGIAAVQQWSATTSITYIQSLTAEFTPLLFAAATIYLVIHGSAKVLLVWAHQKNLTKAYIAALSVIAIFAIVQVIELANGFNGILLGLLLSDLVLIALGLRHIRQMRQMRQMRRVSG